MPQTTPWRASVARLRDRVFPQPSPPAVPASLPDAKAYRASPFVSINGPRAPQWAPRDYSAFAREGFMQNAIVYRAVRMIAEAAGSVPLLVYDGDSDLDAHPLKQVLANPHATTTTADLIEQLVGYLLVSGNSYIEAIAAGGEIRALHALRPDRMHIVSGPDGWPDAFDYTLDGHPTRITGDALPGIPRVLHMKLFHPLNDHYGMSPIEAAASAIDLHNAASAWNKSLLDNSARPSGALIYTARDGNLTTDQFERLKRELEQGFQGALNAGRPLLLEGGLDWKAMSMSPKDMDFLEAKHGAAREIALAIGVPPQLLGIPGDSTYSNYQEANRAFWRHTVIPLVNRIASALTTWLAQPLSETLSIRPDYDQVDALTPERDALWARLNAASFLTTNEKRQAAGYGAHTQGDDLKRAFSAFMSRGGFNPPGPAKFNPNHDGLGRFASGDDDEPTVDLNVQLAAGRKPFNPTPQAPGAAKPALPKADQGVTPGGQTYTKHGRNQATERNFSDQRIDAIVQNNGASRIGKIDSLGNKTWEYRDSRGNTVVTHEGGGIVTVFSPAPKGIDIEK